MAQWRRADPGGHRPGGDPTGFPLAYEVMPGNTSDKTTFFLASRSTVRTESGSWTAASPPKRRWSRCAPPNHPCITWSIDVEVPESALASRTPVGRRQTLGAKELYISREAIPESSLRRRRFKILRRRLHEMQQQTLTRDALLLKLGAAKKEAGRESDCSQTRTSPSPPKPSPFPFAATSCAPCIYPSVA